MVVKKLHPPLYKGIFQCLEAIFMLNQYADKVIERTFKQHKEWGSRDRATVAEAVYGIVRDWRLISALCGHEGTALSRSWWDLTIQIYYLKNQGALPDYGWESRLNQEAILGRLAFFMEKPEYKYSVPDWLYNYGEKQLGREQWEAELAAMHQKAPIILRTNTLKTNVQALAKHFLDSGLGVERMTTTRNGLKLTQGRNVFTLPAFHEGWFEAQDSGSQMVGEFCAEALGPVVIDACAGAGGKTLHLAALMENKGKIYALDVDPNKLQTLKIRARRAGAFNIETRVIENDKVIKKLHHKADLLLIDAPCSGSGVWRRNPDAKWKSKPENLSKLLVLQKDILQGYQDMVKPGGNLVYATCSLFPAENMHQVEQFLAVNKGYKLIDARILSPAKDGTDGFFMARMGRVLE